MSGVWLFVYGTLVDAACQRRVTGRSFPTHPARLTGYRRVHPSRSYPYLVADPDGIVDGVVLEGVDPISLARLDDYEDEGRLYVRRTVHAEVGGVATACEVYVGLGIAAPGSHR